MNRIVGGIILAICMLVLGLTGADAEGEPINWTAECQECYP